MVVVEIIVFVCVERLKDVVVVILVVCELVDVPVSDLVLVEVAVEVMLFVVVVEDV